MEVRQFARKISTKDRLNVVVSSDKEEFIYKVSDVSYGNLEMLFNDMRRKLPKDYLYKKFLVEVSSDIDNTKKLHRISVSRPPLRKK